MFSLNSYAETTRSGGFFPLLDAERQAVIVGSSVFLKDAVDKCTGVKLRVVPESGYKPNEGDYPIYVGKTNKAAELLSENIAKLDIEGYIFLVEPDFAVIYADAPKSDTGNPQVWAEANFARRFMGVDQYFPGPLGQEYPNLKHIRIPCGKWVENPAFKHRHFSGYMGSAGPAWRIRASGGGGRFKFHHNLYSILDPSKYQNHPEYFPVINAELRKKDPKFDHLKEGERYLPPPGMTAYWQPCTTNPEVIRIIVETICKYFADNPGKDGYSLGVNDSGGYCQCPKCLAVFPKGADPASRQANAFRMYKFYNDVAAQVAEKFPDVRLGFLAYGDMNSWQPERLHPILMPYFTQSMADCFDTDYRKRNYDFLSNWSKIAAHIGMYEYLYGSGFLIPRIYMREMAEGLRHARSCGVEGFYAEAYPNWGLDGPKLWVTEKLLWNPDDDVEKLLDTWARGLFHEAGPAMKNYFMYLEKAWMEQKPGDAKRGMYRLMGPQFKKQQFTEVFPPDVCENAWGLLEVAEKEAEKSNSGELVKSRIAYFKSSFGVTRLASNRLNTVLKLEKLLAEETKSRQKLPLEEWLSALEDCARYSTLDAYMDELRIRAPLSFQEFCIESIVKKDKKSFAEWDTDATAIRPIVERIVDEALNADAQGVVPANKEGYEKRIDGVLGILESKVERKDKSCENSVKLLKPLLYANAIDAAVFQKPPVIDGDIEEGWGKPQFDGRLYLYQYENVQAAERTQIWFGLFADKLYLAFRCYQDPATVFNTCGGRDEVKLNERGTVDLGRLFVYLTSVDSVGISLPNNMIAIASSAGGVFDAGLTSAGYDPKKWDGAQAKVKKTGDGWCAEMVLEIGKEDLAKMSSGVVRGYNFFRCVNQHRSCLVPALPRAWSVSPRASGVVFFRKEN